MKALVTGASLGLGRAVATHLSRAGFDVLCTARSEEGLRETLGGLTGERHRIFSTDLSTATGVRALLEVVDDFTGNDGLDIFVNCVGAQIDPESEAELDSTDPERTAEIMYVTATAGITLLGSLRAKLAKPDRSFAIFISSDWGLRGSTGPVAFSVAKAAIRQTVLVAYRSYLRDGIRLTSITPGDIATYDQEWENAKWSLDDDTSAIKKELGASRIAIRDVLSAIDFVMRVELAAVPEIVIAPLKPGLAVD